MTNGLRPFTNRSDDGAPILDTNNNEHLMRVQPNVSIVLGNHAPESNGTLYISSKQVVWLSDADRAKGYAVDFVSVSLHAVSRDPEAFESPCIYTQIDTGDEDDESESCDSESSETPLDLSKITEMRLVPSDPTQLDTLFDVFCECAELNPEPVEEEEEPHNWIFSADRLGAGIDGDIPEWNDIQIPFTIGHANGDDDLASSVLEMKTLDLPLLLQTWFADEELQINDQRFEDAEEMESDNSDEHHH